MERSLQEQYAFKSICYGCGPSNEKGLQIKSIVRGDKVYATFMPQIHHHAFPGVVNGGIIGSILDCHCNWTAAWALMKKNQLNEPPCTVTAEYTIQLKRPTPMGVPLDLEAWVMEKYTDRARIEATLTANGKICASCTGIFVSVKEGHPAFHRW